KNILIVYFILAFASPVLGQKRVYNCVILDSIVNAIQVKKAQNDFLLPLFRAGEIRTDGDSIYSLTRDKDKRRKIDSVLSGLDFTYKGWFLDDTLFSLG